MNLKNANTLVFLKKTFNYAHKSFWKLLIGSVLYLLPLIALAIIPYAGPVLALLIFGWLTTGYIYFVKKTIRKREASFKDIFTQTQKLATVTFLGALLASLSILGFVLFIIPGLAVMVFYCFSIHVFEQDKASAVLENFKRSSEIVKGNKVLLLSYKFVFIFNYAITAFIVVISIYGIQAMNIAPWLEILMYVGTGIGTFVSVATTTMYLFVADELFFSYVVNGRGDIQFSESTASKKKIIGSHAITKKNKEKEEASTIDPSEIEIIEDK